MKLIAQNTINLGDGKYAAPGEEFDIADGVGKALIEAGVAVRKTREVPDDGDAKLSLADVLALAEKEGVTLPAFKAAASKHLQTVPAKKEDIIAALLALPPENPPA